MHLATELVIPSARLYRAKGSGEGSATGYFGPLLPLLMKSLSSAEKPVATTALLLALTHAHVYFFLLQRYSEIVTSGFPHFSCTRTISGFVVAD